MLAEIGLLALGIGTLATLYALVTAYLGARRGTGGALLESSRKAALVTCGLLTLASLIVVYLLVSLDFSVQYVWEVSSRSMSPFLRVTALWGGQPGSMLFWAWLMSAFIAAVLLRHWRENQELMPWVIVFRLKGGGLAGVTLPLVLGGATSGENVSPSE